MKLTKLYARFDQAGDISTANNSINAAKSSGENAINSFDPTQTAGAQINTTNQNFGTAQKEAQGTGDMLTAAVKANPTVTSLYNTANNQFNVPALQTSATRLQNQVTNAVPDAYQGAKGYDIGNAQVQNGIANKEAYLVPQANAATANANTAEGLASNFVQAGQQQNEQNLIPATTEAGIQAQNIASQETGWNTTMANQFNALVAKMQSGVQLSSQEMQTAQQLAATEEAYNQAVVSANAQVNVANIGQEYKQVAPNDTVFNTTNGNTWNPITGANVPLTQALASSMTGKS